MTPDTEKAAGGRERPIILDLCGGTGAWSQPYADAGYDVRVITLDRGYDVREYLPPSKVQGILAAPPCTEFAGSGARWWKTKDPALLKEALEVFDAVFRIICLVPAVWCALENPVGRLRSLRPVLGEPRLIFDPCDYGDPYTKRTLVWGTFTIPAKRKVFPSANKLGSSPIHRMAPGPDRQRLRSITPPGFAQAFFEANP
jgi:hypothetical protein